MLPVELEKRYKYRHAKHHHYCTELLWSAHATNCAGNVIAFFISTLWLRLCVYVCYYIVSILARKANRTTKKPLESKKVSFAFIVFSSPLSISLSARGLLVFLLLFFFSHSNLIQKCLPIANSLDLRAVH